VGKVARVTNGAPGIHALSQPPLRLGVLPVSQGCKPQLEQRQGNAARVGQFLRLCQGL